MRSRKAPHLEDVACHRIRLFTSYRNLFDLPDFLWYFGISRSDYL